MTVYWNDRGVHIVVEVTMGGLIVHLESIIAWLISAHCVHFQFSALLAGAPVPVNTMRLRIHVHVLTSVG